MGVVIANPRMAVALTKGNLGWVMEHSEKGKRQKMIKYFLIVFTIQAGGAAQMMGDLEVKTMAECEARAVYINDSEEKLNAACYPVTRQDAYE